MRRQARGPHNVLGYGTHGDFFGMEAAQVVDGYESPPREPPAS